MVTGNCVATGDEWTCTRPVAYIKTQFCYGHQRQFREHGAPTRPVHNVGPKPGVACSFEGCDRPYESKGFCSVHAGQSRKGETLKPVLKRNPEGTLCAAGGDDWDCSDPASPFTPYCGFHRVTRDETGSPRPRRKRRRDEVLLRDVEGRKRCNGCSTWKPESDFYQATHTSDGFQPDCIDCYLWRNTLRNFKMTREDYESILEAQGGGCAICGVGPVSRRLGVDHDHACCPEDGRSCGECIRGILCSDCNAALGFAKDSKERLLKMIDYLEEAGTK